jgi:hypothetical protein
LSVVPSEKQDMTAERFWWRVVQDQRAARTIIDEQAAIAAKAP